MIFDAALFFALYSAVLCRILSRNFSSKNRQTGEKSSKWRQVEAQAAEKENGNLAIFPARTAFGGLSVHKPDTWSVSRPAPFFGQKAGDRLPF